MKVNVVCYKESGKYYSEGEIEIPNESVKLIPMGSEQVAYIPDVSEYIKKNSEQWPVLRLSDFHTTVTKDSTEDNIYLVPFMITKGSF